MSLLFIGLVYNYLNVLTLYINLGLFPEDLSCDFRDGEICRWDQVGGNWLQFNVALRDNFDWIINSGRTGGAQTGPDGDHTTGSGNYIYLPTSTGIPLVSHTAWFSTHLVLNRNPACMEFFYHMYGRQMGTLSLHQLYNTGLDSMKTLWELSGISNSLKEKNFIQTMFSKCVSVFILNTGDKGNLWHKARLTIPLAPSGDYYILLFKGLVGGQTSDMAVDDILVTSGACAPSAEPVNPGTKWLLSV